MTLLRPSKQALPALAALCALSGCGASAPGATASTPTARPAASEPTRPAALDAPAAAPPRVAAESVPAGLEPLDDAERATLEAADCRAQVQQVAAHTTGARSSGGVIGGATLLIQMLAAATPQTPCLALAGRDTRVYLARTIEVEAIAGLRSLARAMLAPGDGTDVRTALCASAPATPADLEGLRAGATAVMAPSWRGGPWDCAMPMVFEDPVRFQYEIRTAPDGRSSEIIARGFPVANQPRPEELFVRISVGDESAPVVYRR